MHQRKFREMREVSACRSRVKWSSFIGERAALDIENLSRVSDGLCERLCEDKSPTENSG